MKYYLILFTPLFIIFSLTSCKDDIASNKFTILTYNVAGLPHEISSSKPHLYTTDIGFLINDYDIVHVQEDFCYHDSLLLNNHHRYVTQTLGCVPNGDGLNTFSNFPMYNLQRYAWDNCTGADCYTPKGFSYNQIQLKPGVVIDFYNVHANAGGSNNSGEARRGNFKQMMEFIEVNSQDNAVIVAGDMNSRYTRDIDTIRVFKEMGFTDVWIELVRNYDVPAFSPDKLKDCDENPSGFTCEKIDKIFYRSNDNILLKALEFKVDGAQFYHHETGEHLSDHVPVYAKFSYELIE